MFRKAAIAALVLFLPLTSFAHSRTSRPFCFAYSAADEMSSLMLLSSDCSSSPALRVGPSVALIPCSETMTRPVRWAIKR